ncbi:TPA: Arm DNA-binding domain-containing protein [Enterobacter hormaechei]|uniref:site-specific integrase n=1 Tax=Enterobacter cloacae complex TaxID=354276 RepID=UPI000792BE66|nr:site-specific integrase [Enterobacter hormaechei]HCJ6423224.1 site-specific integrase [Enterobacter hormaechei subsp. xiangfangensis]MCE1310611.1 site-specific integrase [Enterobacter hormaechei]MCM7057738.1 site-specific integrase [Enterobacter hormaechei]MDE7632962.1 site-specific integrase [Enterobacter hormaechei]MDV0435033.1 site-specific integrase [Enterobacter hormaechei]
MAGFPTGVEIHSGKLRISFKYKNVRCREVLQGWAITNANIKKAGNLRALICAEIQLGTFKYEERFPESKALKKFSSPGKSVSTFGDLCDAYHAVKEVEISPSTMMITRSVSALFTKIIGESTAIEDIQLNDMLLYRKKLLEGEFKSRGEGQRTVRTVNSFMSQLCRMLSFAYLSNYIQHKPFENIKSLKTSELDPDPLLKEEFEALTKHWKGQPLNLWTFAVYTGLRHGELTGLAWEDVDLVNGEVHVKRTMTLTKRFGPPKTKAGIRTIKLLKPALDALTSQFELTGHKEPMEIVLHHRERGKTERQKLKFCFVPNHEESRKSRHYSQNTIKLTWSGAMRKAGVRHRSPYHIRHTFACWLLSAGANPSFIASQMGHKNARMVYTVYSKWIARMNDDQIGMLNAKL